MRIPRHRIQRTMAQQVKRVLVVLVLVLIVYIVGSLLMSLAARKQCLYQLKRLGFQTGAGYMVAIPGQTYR